MAAKDILFDAKGREQILAGVNILADTVKARELQPDGTYKRLQPANEEDKSQAQLHFRERSRRQARKMAEAQNSAVIKLAPILTSHRLTPQQSARRARSSGKGQNPSRKERP